MFATLLDMLGQSAGRVPDRPALVFRERRVTYAALHAGARRLGARLVAAGVQPGERVALLLPNTPEFPLAYFGILAAGAAVVPVNPLLAPDEIRHIVLDSGAVATLALRSAAPLLEAARAGAAAPAPLIFLDEAFDGGGTADRLPAVHPDSAAACLYTSGTTGRPKGAVLTHANLVANLRSFHAVLRDTEDEVFLAVLPLFHAYGATALMLEPLSIGATIALEPRFVPDVILRAIVENRVTIFMGVPSMFAVLAGLPPVRGDRWRFCISGGAPLPPAVLEAFEARHGVPIYEGYGPTECSPVLTVNPPGGLRKIGSVGPAIPGVDLRVVDEHDAVLPAGGIGEVVARGANVMQGYLNRPVETAAVLRGGWYHTGDLGRLDGDGYLYIVDRKTDLILVAGLNVYPSEVERVLVSHPDVAEAAVVGLPDALRGEAVTAHVIPRNGCAPSPPELVQWCRQHLAGYKVPRTIRIVAELPRTLTGKVLKSALKGNAPSAPAQADIPRTTHDQ